MHASLRSYDTEEVRPERRAAEALVEAGDLEGARLQLEATLAADPDDAAARGLLGLCCFKLGRLHEAARIYTALVERNPGDATLRVNLGLVALKRGAAAEAVVQFEAAVKLAPGHKKALNYLGLALAQRGELGLARDAFERAGSAGMAARMAEQLDAQHEAARAALHRAAEEAGVAEAELAIEIDDEPMPAAALEEPEEPAANADVDTAPEPAAETVPEPVPAEAATLPAALRWPAGRPFGIGPEGAAIEFGAEIRTRLDGLVAAHGVAAWTPVHKRFRGAEIERLFGTGPRALWRATGGGRLLFASRGRTFSDLQVGEGALGAEVYLVEGHVFAFDEGLTWENGRLPGQATDLHLVRFGGAGHVLLATDLAVRTERVVGGCLSLPTAGLVGWSGALAPRLVGAEEGPAVPWIELTGTGVVLLQA